MVCIEAPPRRRGSLVGAPWLGLGLETDRQTDRQRTARPKPRTTKWVRVRVVGHAPGMHPPRSRRERWPVYVHVSVNSARVCTGHPPARRGRLWCVAVCPTCSQPAAPSELHFVCESGEVAFACACVDRLQSISIVVRSDNIESI